MSWVREGTRLRAKYLGHTEVEGVVVESRIKYGGMVVHTVEVEKPINLYGLARTRFQVYEEEIVVYTQ